jgi:SNF2 family DNA or RNA helicase
VQWIDKPGIELSVGALIDDITIHHKFEDCVDIPPNYQYPLSFDLSDKSMKLYLKLKAENMLKFSSGQTITAINGGVLYQKLLQAASGAIYSGDDKYILLDTARHELIMDLVDARKHSVVFFNWKHQRDELIKLATAQSITFAVIDGDTTRKGERERIVAGYQTGAYKVLLAHPASAGHGLTLTRGTTTIFASPTPNLEWFLQGYKRIYRISQTEKTETIMLLARGTIDEKVWESLQRKDLSQGILLDYLKG